MRKEDLVNTKKMVSKETYPRNTATPCRYKNKVYDVMDDGEKYWYIPEGGGNAVNSIMRESWIDISKHQKRIEELEDLF